MLMLWFFFCVDLCGNNFQWQEAKRVKATDPRPTKGSLEGHRTRQRGRGRDVDGGRGRGRARGRARGRSEPEPELEL